MTDSESRTVANLRERLAHARAWADALYAECPFEHDESRGPRGFTEPADDGWLPVPRAEQED